MSRLSPYLPLLALLMTLQGVAQTRLQPPASQLTDESPVSIGLLLPDQTHADMIEAAELAIQRANAGGGYLNRKFILVVRTAQGFWGAGSKESVNLVYEDNVCAIIGSLDGRNGHLAEQVAAKSHLTYIETFATDPTLSQAFVPWFMRVVPNDNQQASVILKQIRREGGGKTAILSQETYDTRYAVSSLTKAVTQGTGVPPLVLPTDTSSKVQSKIIEEILRNGIDNLVIPFDAAYLKELIVSLRVADPALRIYGNLHFAMGAESREPDWSSYEGVCLVTPGVESGKHTGLAGYRSAYLYDAVNMVINAVRQAGPDRQAIATQLSKTEFSFGATGGISFDEMGNRRSVPALSRIVNGELQLLGSSTQP